MTFSYNTNIPASGDAPSQDQPLMQTNTNSINSILDVDHVSFNQSNGGFHRQSQYLSTNAIPAGLVTGTGNVYSKTVGSVSQLFFSPDNSSNEYQMTRSIGASFSTFAANSALTVTSGSGVGGWTFLAGNLIMQYGTCTNTSSGTTVTFPVAFSSGVYAIELTNLQNTTNRHFVYARSVSTTNFVTTQLDSGGSAESSSFSFIAIGV